jgi:hypothetical protein
MVRSVELVAVPSVVVTDIFPVETRSPKLVVIEVALLTVTFAASTLPSFTVEAAVKLLPVIVMDSPWQIVAGEKEVMVGAGGGV